MTKNMAIGDFKWVEKSLSEKIAEPNDSAKGFFVMVDLEYPSSLHDNNNDFPLAAEKMKISETYLSSYQKSFSRHEATTEKLMETLFNKTDYVCHYSILKFFVKHGLKITKITEVLQCKQSNFLKSYVELNTQLRQQSGISDSKTIFFTKFLSILALEKPWKI